MPEQIATATTYQPTPNTVHRAVGADIVLLDLDSGTYFTLAGTGADIWNYLCAGLNAGQIANALVDEYEVPLATVERDIADLIQHLTSSNLLSAN
jgi:hypothetical protein